MDTEYKCGQMEQGTKAIGKMEKQQAEESSLMSMAISTMASGDKIKPVVKEYICTTMVLGTKENGSRTISTDMESKNGSTAVVTKVCTSKAKSTDRANIHGKMVASTKETGWKIKLLASASMCGLTEEDI